MATALAPKPSVVTEDQPAFRWLRTGDEALESLLSAIDQARESIRLETYIYRTGQTGERFRAALISACDRGVKVRVMIDALGSFSLPETFWTPLRDAGAQCTWFNPLALGRWSYRDHRKMLVCDDAVAFIGGFNIADEYHGDGVTHGWRDLGLEIRGSRLVRALAQSFDAFFDRAVVKHKRLQRFRKASHEVSTGETWQLLMSGPGRYHGPLQRVLKQDLANARSVKIICAYFLPTWRLRKVLTRICKRGGRVQLILAGKSDVAMSQLASRRLYGQFLRSGVEIYEYEPQILHAKLFIMDDVVYAGSANLDVRSLKINYELLVRISDREVAERARDIFEDDLKYCRKIDPATWRKSRNLWSKLKERWAYFFLARVDPYLARQQLRLLR
ncbi:MAG TPA: phospholipase D-like domain-containing protein [Candidatus Binatia bacterium]|nr:phospholipase D-like domain-containing protein [Candidatus Binatia bacterium]